MSFETVTIGPCTLIRGDCLEVLPTLRGVDAVVTDPPYGVQYADWDSEIPTWLPLARRIAPAVVFTTAPTTLWEYPKPDWLAAYSRQGATTRNATGGFCHWTPVLVYGDVKLPVDFRPCNDKRAHLEAIADGRAAHPCPKPLEVYRWIVSWFTGTICDPFMGSATTAIACIAEGREFIGIENDAEHFATACDQVRKAWKLERSKLPLEKPVTYTQRELITA